MTPEMWQKVSALLEQLEKLQDSEIEQFLLDLEKTAPELAREVRSLHGQQNPNLSRQLENLSEKFLDSDPTDKANFLNENTPNLAGQDSQPVTSTMPEEFGKYRVIGELACGGMGAIWRVQDTDFQRPTAIKVLLQKRQNDPAFLRRFWEEAQITGKLQHPGIPPVHEIGHLPDGRPFFAMKLIEGKTLSELLNNRKSPADNLPHFLGIFEQICQTVAYAHSENVIHRDLKPSNIMVGAFGEVQVMDWGLAKNLDGEQGNDNAKTDPMHASKELSELTTAWQRFEGDSRTQAGAILGTVTHMAPEQARGEIAEVGKASDVFGLGAILCQILTGVPPFVGEDVSKVLPKAQQGDWQSSREILEKSGVDAELIAVTMRCLEKEKSRRFQDAGHLAQVISNYQESVQEKLKRTELERTAAEARASSERKRRRTQLTAVGVVIALLTVGTFIGFSIKRQNDAALLTQEKKLQAESLVEQILAADTRDMPALVAKLRFHRSIVDPLLLEALTKNGQTSSRQKLHVSLGLLPVDAGQVDYLYGRLLNAEPHEVPVIVDALALHKDQLLDRLWAVAESPEKGKETQRLRAAAALAKYEPKSEKWAKVNAAVVNDLVSENPIFLGQWSEVFRPVKAELLSPLSAIFRDREPERLVERKLATNLLADYAAGNIAVLVDLLLDANEDQFAIFYPLLAKNREQAMPLLTSEIDKQPIVVMSRIVFETRGIVDANDTKLKGKLPAKRFDVSLQSGKSYHFDLNSQEFDTLLVLQDNNGKELAFDDDGGGKLNSTLGYSPPKDGTYAVFAASYRGTGAFKLEVLEISNNNDAKEKLAKRQVNAAVALLKMNQPEKVWPLLKHSTDPRVRSYLIHKFGPSNADVRVLVERLNNETDVTIRRALLLSLGSEEFGDDDWIASEKKALVTRLKNLYQTDPDPGLHGATEWLLRQWKEEQWLKQVNAEWAQDKAKREGWWMKESSKNSSTAPQWYVNGQGQTMVVIPGPVEFLMGSPLTEKDRRADEVQHKKTISRSFAMAAKAVTVADYRKFDPDYIFNEQYAPNPDCPVVSTSWYNAAAYCNWLSQKEGIPEEQWCYVTDAKGQVTQLRANYLSLTGYRLPTEAEMEYATRAKTTTSRYFGETEELLGEYAWYYVNANERSWPVGLKKPNDFGLFDMQGNVFAWCQDRYSGYSPEEDREDGNRIINSVRRVLRGGSFSFDASELRSAQRVAEVPSLTNFVIGFRPTRTLFSETRLKSSNVNKANPNAQSITGQLTDDDPLDRFPLTKKSFADVHEVDFKKDEIYQIDLNAKFDPYLRIETAEKMPLVDNDDASPPALSSRIIFSPKKDGKYRLISTSYKPGETGDYKITISPMQKSPFSKTFKESLVKSPQTIQGKFIKLHKLELEANTPYTFHLASQKFDTFLVVIDNQEKRPVVQNDDTTPGNTNESRIDFTPSSTGSYTILVTSFEAGETGGYELTVQGYEPKTEDKLRE